MSGWNNTQVQAGERLTLNSVSVSQSKQRSNSNYQSVHEQSGLQAGDSGLQVNVQGDTALTGAAIASGPCNKL